MKKLTIILALLLSGCSGPDEVREHLESQGMTNIRFRGYDLFSCESKHIYAHRFAAETDGVDNLVIVCAEDGFKNPDVRPISSKFTKGDFR